MDRLPVAVPAELGAKRTLSVALDPGWRAVGTANPLMLKPAPETLAAVIVNAAFPEFVRITCWVELLPTLTLPKL